MRRKGFDTDEALLAALSSFWEWGFEGTNMPELLESMKLGRASFYNAFVSKREVFLKCLLFVEPRLIGNLDVVSVRITDVCREVVGTPFGPKARFLV